MKICHIATGFPISHQGGITNYVRSLASHQMSQKNEVWVLSGPDDAVFNFNVQCYRSNKIIPMKWRKPVDKQGLALIKNFLDEHQFDLIHIHMMLDVDWDIYEVLRPYKYVVSLHDYYFLCPRIQMIMHDNALCTAYEEEKCARCITWFNTKRVFNGIEYKISHKTALKNFRFPAIPQSMTKERFQKFKTLLENASMLLPVSERVQEIFKNSGIEGNYKVLHIGNVTADHFKEEFEFEWDKAKISLTMLGNLSYIKGGDLLLKIAKNIDTDKIVINFYGRSGSYKDKIAKVGIIDHGAYRQEDLPDILKNTDMGLVLSVWEDNGPQVVMEFLNNHIPVIGTKMGGIPDFVKDNDNGMLFNPYESKEVDEVIDKINSMTREKIYQLTQNITRTTTTAEHCCDMDKVYIQIIERR